MTLSLIPASGLGARRTWVRRNWDAPVRMSGRPDGLCDLGHALSCGGQLSAGISEDPHPRELIGREPKSAHLHLLQQTTEENDVNRPVPVRPRRGDRDRALCQTSGDGGISARVIDKPGNVVLIDVVRLIRAAAVRSLPAAWS